MSQSKAEQNKALVLEAFDTLFNKKDYVSAEKFWSNNYIQHSAHPAGSPGPVRSGEKRAAHDALRELTHHGRG
jgi:predicted SnoaL-like aldol condensation-catalyzing enzyme